MSGVIHLAIDLGAESGRVMAVGIDGDQVALHEVHRFRHEPLHFPSGLHWNITGIWQGVLSGLRVAAEWARGLGHAVRSVGVDAWGVDWALLDANGELVALPHAYRDPRNCTAYEDLLARLPAERIYHITGIQLMPINSLFSLAAMAASSPHLLQSARRLVFIPDLIHYWLCGAIAVERTIASTSQLIDIQTSTWSDSLLNAVDVPRSLFGDIVPAGTDLGCLRDAIAVETGLDAAVRVIAPAAHDTASAVAAVPATGESSWAFLSSGTWSLFGAELPSSCTNAQAREWNFTNEAGVGSTVRFLKNIAGLWLVQECRRAWGAAGQEWSYEALTQAAASASPWRTLVDAGAPQFQRPGQMPDKIADFARATGQPVPMTPGEFVRCALESLALAYRRTLGMLETVLAKRIERVYIVGGGSQNQLLNQLTADACQRSVFAGPAEATAIGNGLVQAMACGALSNLGELRRVVSSSLQHASQYEPRPSAEWSDLESRW